MNKNIIVGLVASIAILGGIVFLSNNSKNAGAEQKLANVPASNGSLTIDETSFDFGTISMAKGKVTHNFKIKNIGNAALAISKVYTSCMCTEALLKIDTNNFGPFGMPGHMAIPSINASLPTGKEAEVEAIFDPAAHGPAGVGKIERVVYLETSAGLKELNFKAVVTP